MARTCGSWSGYCGGCRCGDCRIAARRYREEKLKRPRTCIKCGKQWLAQHADAKYCSNTCQAAHEHGDERRPKRKPKPKPSRREVAAAKLARAAAGTRGHHVLVAGWCALCSASAVEGPGNILGSVFYCSARCRLAARGRGLHRKVSPALRSYIYRRDRGVCHLCRRRVAMTKAAPHPRSPVLDHLVPLSLGGSTTRDNLRLAHWLCNEVKSNRPANEQLMLVG
jgi:hypothetical protein